MVSWIKQLCVLCAISAMMQMVLPKSRGRESVGMICGLLMLHLTCECAVKMVDSLAACEDLSQVFSLLIK